MFLPHKCVHGHACCSDTPGGPCDDERHHAEQATAVRAARPSGQPLPAFTYPRTTSDGRNPVTQFKSTVSRSLNHIADREAERRTVTMRRVKDTYWSLCREATLRDVAAMLDNIIVEGE